MIRAAKLGQYNGVRSLVEMKVHLRGEDGIMTDAGRVVGLRIGSYESQGTDGSCGVLLFDGLIDLTLASTAGETRSTGSVDEQRVLAGSCAAISAALILAVVMIIRRRRVRFS
jgi:hypothetical protein